MSSLNYYVFFCVTLLAVVSCQFSWIGGPKDQNLQSVWNEKGVSNSSNLLASRAAGAYWVFDNQTAYVWGGLIFEPFEASFNDMWRLDYVDGSVSWTWINGVVNSTFHPGVYPSETMQSGPQYFPRARLLPGFWKDSKGLMWLAFGLYKRNPYQHTNDVWYFNATEEVWTFVDGIGDVDRRPTYGPGGLPGGRGGMATWVDENDDAWFFSGTGLSTVGDQGPLSDLWFFNTTDREWTYIGGPQILEYKGSFGIPGVANETNWPPGRFSSIYWKDNTGKFFMFGGCATLNHVYNDVWFYVKETGLWTWISGGDNTFGSYAHPGVVHPDNHPGSRFLSQWWVDSQSNVWIFGGLGFSATTGEVQNDVWIYHANTTMWGYVFGPASGTNGTYSELGQTSPTAIPPRRGGSIGIRFGSDDDMLLYGGGDPFNVVYGLNIDSPFYSDIWKVNISMIPYTIYDGSNPTTGSTTTGNTPDAIVDPIISSSGSNTGLIVGLTVSFGLLALIAVAIVFFLLWRNQQRKRNREMNEAVAMENNDSTSYAAIPKPASSLALANQRTYFDVQIQERLGGGNFGDVYKGIWSGTTPVALKKLKNSEGIQEFEIEAEMLARLKHPNIVQYFGIFIDKEKSQYIMTELMLKGSLHTLLTDEDANYSLFDLLGIAKQAAAGMLYLHGQKVLHRDLALRNLLATTSKDSDYKFLVKVADFGLSKMMKENEYYSAENKVLPYKWVALEVIKYGKFSLMSDVWSFGITLWELMSSGQTPYTGMNNAEAVEKVVQGYRLPKPSICPDSLYQVMLGCWQEEPHNRPSFDEIYQKIEELWHSTKAVEEKTSFHSNIHNS